MTSLTSGPAGIVTLGVGAATNLAGGSITGREGGIITDNWLGIDGTTDTCLIIEVVLAIVAPVPAVIGRITLGTGSPGFTIIKGRLVEVIVGSGREAIM